jgi:hypothetical protein
MKKPKVKLPEPTKECQRCPLLGPCPVKAKCPKTTKFIGSGNPL